MQSVSFMPASPTACCTTRRWSTATSMVRRYELLGTGNIMVGVTSGVTASSAITNGVSVISNTTYWIGIAHDNAIYVTVADDRVSNGASGQQYLFQRPAGYRLGDRSCPGLADVGRTARGLGVQGPCLCLHLGQEYGEEGPPSCRPSSTAGRTPPGPSLVAARAGEYGAFVRNITTTRIYRSITNQTGQGTYFLVAEIPVTQRTL